MEHRRFLAHPEAHRPFAGGALFAQLGGRAAVEALIDGLYDRIERDRVLRPLFGRDLTQERGGQKRFFTEWLGGGHEYSGRAHHGLAHRHDLLPITRELAEKWLAHFSGALEAAVSDAQARTVIGEKVRVLAGALVNEAERSSALRAGHHGTCLRYPPAIESLQLARRGDAASLRALLERAPDVLASAPHAAALMHVAALAGRVDVVSLLLARGVDVDKPAPIAPLIFVTPLCAARARRRKELARLLVHHGAKEDLFTHAFLGELGPLELELAQDPSSAQTVDPAVDALEVTPVHHAVAGGSVEALRLLLAQTARAATTARTAKTERAANAAQTAELSPEPALLGGVRALRDAAEREDVAMVTLLLEHGADATELGAGRWVLHPQLAPMLAGAGASVDRTGAWIGLACTGNQGRKDDPQYVAALLRYGARVDDKRLTGQGTDGGRATALHYAAKSGFTKTITVLLEHGADASAKDDNGRTPLDWLERAAKSVDRQAVRRALAGAAPPARP